MGLGSLNGWAQLLVGWLLVAAAVGWAVVTFAAMTAKMGWRIVGAVRGPLVWDAGRRAFLGAVAPTSSTAEMSAIGMVCCGLRCVYLEVLSDCQSAINVTQCTQRAQDERVGGH